MDLNIVCPRSETDAPASPVIPLADTGRKIGLAAFAVVNLNSSSQSAQPKFGGWLSHE
jgi:hypothetical protein